MPQDRAGGKHSLASEAGTARSWPLLPITLAVAFAGLFAALVLSAGHVLDLPVPCGRSRGCAAVASHPASRVLGVPIAYAGIAAYVGLILLLLSTARSRVARIAFFAAAALGTAASLALLAYSRSVIRATCPWCVASGIAMTLLALLGALLVWRGARLRPLKPAFVLALGLLTSAAAGVQAGVMQKNANSPPIPAERLEALGADDLVDPAKSVGPADALVTIVVFADLWCPACRSAMAALVSYQQKHPAGVRLAYRHLPLWDIRGHESSGAAAALSEIAAEEGRFWPFIHAIHRQQSPMDRAGYFQLLTSLGMDAERAEARIADGDDPAVLRVWKDVELADSLGTTATPTFILLVEGHPPISANQRTLPRILNSAAVLPRLLSAAQTKAD